MRRNGWCLEPFFQPEVRSVERYLDGETADCKRGRHFHEPRQQFANLPHAMAPPRGTVEQAAQLHWQSRRSQWHPKKRPYDSATPPMLKQS